MSRWIVSVDLGQSIDPTAIAVLEILTRRDVVAGQFEDPPSALAPLVSLDWFVRGGRTDGQLRSPSDVVRVNVRHLERLPLKMAYPDQVARDKRLQRTA